MTSDPANPSDTNWHDEWRRRATAVHDVPKRADGREDFPALAKAAGLDPARHLRFADWSGIDFSGSDLRGFDFTGATLLNCAFTGALIEGARFDKAIVGQVAPVPEEEKREDRENPKRSGRRHPKTQVSDLRVAADFEAWRTGWVKPERPVTDGHLGAGAVFQDSPISPQMVVIPPGRFLMGSPVEEVGRYKNEEQREVVIGRAFALGRFPVTNEEWVAVADAPRGRMGDALFAANEVSWNDITGKGGYLGGLRDRTGCDCRLPGEDEWEYACRSGTSSPYYFGHAIAADEASFGGRRPAIVGTFPENAFGLHDVHGTVWEWCDDLYTANVRVLRGGSWGDSPAVLRAASRSGDQPNVRGVDLGLRLARTLNP